jgi:uncharacterized protein
LVPISGDMRKILAKTVIKEHPDDYSIVFIDPEHGKEAWDLAGDLKPFTSFTITVDEVSVVLRSSDWVKLRGSFPGNKEEGPYRLITFDIVLDLSVVGFLSVVSTTLAESGVSVYALSTYLKDHILVKKRDAGKAIGVLNGMIAEARVG